MSVRRGDVVVIDWPFAGGGGSKPRPAVVIQNDRDNRRLANTIVVMVTGRVSRVGEPTQLPIDVGTPEGRQSGLHHNSVVNCANIFTVEQTNVIRTIGSVSAVLLQKINDCLRAALELP